MTQVHVPNLPIGVIHYLCRLMDGIQVQLVHDLKKMETIFEIRRIVFVVEQNVNATEEYDEFESSSVHFLAHLNGIAVGTARYRETSIGIKLERFAVLKEWRKHGVGKALVLALIQHIGETNKPIYLHAQTHAVPFYEKFDFKTVGPLFYEANIPHFKMTLSELKPTTT